MIHVYDFGNQNYDRNGNAILIPTSGKVRMAAGGNYELNFTAPMDPEGRWKHLVKETVVKAPVPKEIIENAFAGLDADIYVTTAAAALRSGPSEPTTITYTMWSISADYSVGAKVTWNNKNWQCNYYDETSPYAHVAPGSSPWWVQIARTTPGDPALVNLKSGTDLYYVSGPSDGWYKMSTTYGLEGYIKSSQVEYSRHITPEETKPRVITDQLFKIKTVTKDSEAKTVTVYAQHVSYALNGVLIDKVSIVRKPPAEALAWIQQGFMMDYRGTIATNMATFADSDYSAEISGKSGMYALLDPDCGVVPAFDAEFRRDNWDLFVMAKTNTDRGYMIRYSNNMRGVTDKEDTINMRTRIVPVAKDENGEDLYLDPVRWVDSSHVNEYETVYMERLRVEGQVGKDDGSETNTQWTTETLRAEMAKQAQALFDVEHIDEETHEITVVFEMLGDTKEYAWLKDLQSVLLYDTVHVINDDTDTSFSVTVDELEYDIVKLKVTAAKLTNVKKYNVRNVTGYNMLDNSITGDKLTDEAGDQLTERAVDKATEEAASYTDQKATQTLAKVGSFSGYATYDAYIKDFISQHYAPL